MLRVTWRSAPLVPRLLSEDEFVGEFEPLAQGDFAGLPPGPVVVEGLDARQRLAWRAHYRSARELRALLRQLAAEREIRARGPGAERVPTPRARP